MMEIEGRWLLGAAERSGPTQQSSDAVARDKSDSHDGPPDKRALLEGKYERHDARHQHASDSTDDTVLL